MHLKWLLVLYHCMPDGIYYMRLMNEFVLWGGKKFSFYEDIHVAMIQSICCNGIIHLSSQVSTKCMLHVYQRAIPVVKELLCYGRGATLIHTICIIKGIKWERRKILKVPKNLAYSEASKSAFILGLQKGSS